MKNLKITMTILLMATQTFAAIDLNKQEQKLTSVLQLEQKQDYFGAVLSAGQASSEILNQLRVDEIVATVDTQMTQIRNEIVTKKYNVSGGFNILFSLITGQANRSWDSATIITANPQEVDGFSAKISNDFRSVQQTLKVYVVKNELALSYAKAFALKTAQLATKLSATDRKNLLPMIKASIQFSQQLRFLGAQNVLSCVQTNYADRTDKTSMGLGGLLLYFDLSEDNSQMAYTDTKCKGSTNLAEVNESVLASARLAKLDMLIASYQKQLGLQEVTEAKADAYQTWGLPSYK